MTCTLILGGARSGKSALAERLAGASGKEVVYLATAHAGDGEMSERIAQHRAQRPVHWRTVEESLGLAAALERECTTGRLVLVDCLTLWLTNLMLCDSGLTPDVGAFSLPPRFDAERCAFLDLLDTGVDGELLLVSNEVGMGSVPLGALSRRFADEAGRLNQAVAARAQHVVLVAAGLPLTLKGRPC